MRGTVLWLVALIGLAGAHIWVLTRLMPHRRDLLEDATGLRRFRDFIDQPVRENYSARNYGEAGLGYLRWLRLTAALGTIALVGTVLSVAK
jgi:hypothetical protein